MLHNEQQEVVVLVVVQWKEITDAVTFHIVNDMAPVYTVGKGEFIQIN